MKNQLKQLKNNQLNLILKKMQAKTKNNKIEIKISKNKMKIKILNKI